jgi:hypothetical protein
MNIIIWMLIGLLGVGLNFMLMIFTHVILPIFGFLINIIIGLFSLNPKIGLMVLGIMGIVGFLLIAS